MKFKKIYIEITNKCNFNCPFCSKDNREEKEMSIDEFEHVLKEVKPYTDYLYLHVKGEPLYHSNFKDIILLCEKYKFKVNITTNGSLIKDNLEILKNKCIRQINISLQSYKNINLVNDIIKYCDILSKDKYIIYRLWALDNMILSKDNEIVLKLLYDHYKCNSEKISHNIYLSKNKLFDWPSLDSKEYSDGYCLGCKTHIGILSNGTVIPCCLDSKGIVDLGNIFNKNLKDILESKRFITMKESFKNNKCSEELCKHCSYKNNFKK